MAKSYIKVTPEAGQQFFSKQHDTPMVMLNLLKYKAIADYADAPHLKPEKEISGLEAYKLYMKAVMPLLAKIGSELIFSGTTDQFLIGPIDEKWDYVLLVRHQNMNDFLAFASDQEYLNIAGHRTAALADSRLLPIKQSV